MIQPLLWLVACIIVAKISKPIADADAGAISGLATGIDATCLFGAIGCFLWFCVEAIRWAWPIMLGG